jgi:site-specific DNA recombinase
MIRRTQLPPRASEVRPGAPSRPARRSDTPRPALVPAVTYARVSSKDQEKEGYSIPAQQSLLRSYAVENGYNLVENYVDVETAKRAGRTAFGNMLTFLKMHHSCKVVLVEKTDRLYRNLKDWVRLDEMGLEIHLVKEGTILSDSSRSTDKFMHGIRVLMAKNYIDNLSEEVQKGMRQKAEEGYWPSSAPVGFLNQQIAGRSYLALDPVKGPLVRELIEQYDTGESAIPSLVDWCGRVGLVGKKGTPLNHTTVHGILRNPLYAGKFIWGGRLYDGKDPTIISWETWERVQGRLDGHPYTRAVEHAFAFTGLLTCGHCGAAITAEIKKGAYVYYHCVKKCVSEPYIREERLVGMLAEVIRPLQVPADMADAAAHGLRAGREIVRAETERRTADLRDRYDRIGRLIDRAYDDKLEGRVDQAFFDRKRTAWEAERWEVQRELERIAAADRESIETGLMLLEFSKRAYDLFNSMDNPWRAKLAKLALSNCTLAGGRLTPTYRIPLDILADFPRNPETGNPASEGAGAGFSLMAVPRGIEPLSPP